MKTSIKFVFILFVVLFGSNRAEAQLEFFEGTFIPHNLNYDGSVVVGVNRIEHLLWQESQGIKAIGGACGMPYSGRVSVSDDGLIIGGSIAFGASSEMAIYNVSEGAWINANIVADTMSQEIYTSGYRISGDGSLLVGIKGFNYYLSEPLVFDANGNASELPYPDTEQGARANVVNTDGSVIGGCVINSSMQRDGAYWVNNTFYRLLDENSNPVGEVMAVSADGSTLFGYGYGDNHDIYKYDITTNSIKVLCAANVNGGVAPVLIDMSDDGRVAMVVYYNYTDTSLSQVYIYVDKIDENEEDIYMNINDFLDSMEIDRKGVNVNHVVGISGNGQVLVGIDGSDSYTSPSYRIEMGNIISVSDVENQTKAWAVFPNPAKDRITLNLPKDCEQLSISDMHGKIIKIYSKKNCPAILDISDLPNGMYLLHAKTKHTDMFNKLMKY